MLLDRSVQSVKFRHARIAVMNVIHKTTIIDKRISIFIGAIIWQMCIAAIKFYKSTAKPRNLFKLIGI